MRRISLILLMLMVGAASLSAQRRPRVYSSEPDTWISGSIAGFRSNGVNDGATGSTWDFGNSTNLQYRASLRAGNVGWTDAGNRGQLCKRPVRVLQRPRDAAAFGCHGHTLQCMGCNAAIST